MKKILLAALLTLVCQGALARPAYSYNRYAMTGSASYSVKAVLDRDMVDSLTEGVPLRLVPAALTGANGLAYGALTPVLRLEKSWLKDEGVTCSFNAGKRSLKYATKEASLFPFLLYDGRSTNALVLACSQKYSGSNIDVSFGVLDGLNFYLENEGRPFSGIRMPFLPKGKKLQCKQIFEADGCAYRVNASLNPKNNQLKLTLKYAGNRGCLLTVDQREIDLAYDATFSCTGFGSCWLNPVDAQHVLLCADNWETGGEYQVICSPGGFSRQYLTEHVEMGLNRDTEFKLVFPRYKCIYHIEKNCRWRQWWQDATTIQVWVEPVAGYRFDHWEVEGETYYDGVLTYTLQRDTAFKAVCVEE